MDFNSIVSDIEQLLPNRIVNDTLKKVLDQALLDGMYVIEVEEGTLRIPLTVEIIVLTKAVFKEYLPLEGFGDIKVLVSLGEVLGKNGIYRSRYCFTTLYFNGEANLITCDFHTDWR